MGSRYDENRHPSILLLRVHNTLDPRIKPLRPYKENRMTPSEQHLFGFSIISISWRSTITGILSVRELDTACKRHIIRYLLSFFFITTQWNTKSRTELKYIGLVLQSIYSLGQQQTVQTLDRPSNRVSLHFVCQIKWWISTILKLTPTPSFLNHTTWFLTDMELW